MLSIETSDDPVAARPERKLGEAIWRGFRCRCPNCGEGRLFGSFPKTVDTCSECGERIDHHRADDLPAYLVIFIVGHIVVAGFMAAEAAFVLTMWQHLAMWVPVTILGSLALLQPVKGAVIGLQWALYMHGFGDEPDTIDTHPEA